MRVQYNVEFKSDCLRIWNARDAATEITLVRKPVESKKGFLAFIGQTKELINLNSSWLNAGQKFELIDCKIAEQWVADEVLDHP